MTEKVVGPSALEKRRERDRARAARKRTLLTPEQKVEQAIYLKEWRAANPERTRKLKSESEARLRLKDPEGFRAQRCEISKRHALRRGALLDEAKNRPCMDCGNSYPPCVMDFDHRDPSQKSRVLRSKRVIGMRGFAASRTREALLAEIAKCDVVCANCHRLRTAKQRADGLLRKNRPRSMPDAAE